MLSPPAKPYCIGMEAKIAGTNPFGAIMAMIPKSLKDIFVLTNSLMEIGRIIIIPTTINNAKA